ncbi:MAG: TIGR02611 family protein [Actinomycetota bacterium]|nr:TIGR02611 family protein [Actinomycetota bacterium]
MPQPDQEIQDAESDDDGDWAWRRRIRARSKSYLVYRVVVGVVGVIVTIGGLVLIPAPGPGWLVVFLGLAILASEFEWADRLLAYARHQVGRWTDWAARQSLPVRLLLGLATLALLVGIFWVTFRLAGVPGFVPDSWVPSWIGRQP